MQENVFTGHVLTPAPLPGEKGPTTRILYCPSEADDADLAVAEGSMGLSRWQKPTKAVLVTEKIRHVP